MKKGRARSFLIFGLRARRGYLPPGEESQLHLVAKLSIGRQQSRDRNRGG